MSEVSTGSDPAVPPPPPDSGDVSRAVNVARIVGVSFLGVLGVVFAGWTLTQYFSSPEEGDAPLSEVEAPGGGAGGVPDVPVGEARGMVKVYVSVVLMETRSKEVDTGTPLPRSVSLKLVGKDGRSYEAQFDRVGVWLMEVPPGEYLVPSDQPGIVERKWELGGPGVTDAAAGGRYAARFENTAAPQRMKLTLR